QKDFPNSGTAADQSREKNVRINDDGRIHFRSLLKRLLFCVHQLALTSSESFQAASSVKRPRRAAASTRNQSRKARTASADIPSVGMFTRISWSLVSTAIMPAISSFQPSKASARSAYRSPCDVRECSSKDRMQEAEGRIKPVSQSPKSTKSPQFFFSVFSFAIAASVIGA